MLQAVHLQFDPTCVSDAPGSADRRTSERQRCVLDLEVELDHESHFFTGLSQDISEGGLFVATYHLVPVGMPLSLRLLLSDGSHVEARGQVRWVRDAPRGDVPPGVGIAFVELSESARQRIVHLCAQRPPLFFEC